MTSRAKLVSPFGAWRSPITSDLLVEKALRLGGVQADGGSVYWIEGRAAERGRQVLVRDGEDVLGPDANVRTLVHEYGGRSFAVRDGLVVFSEMSDQRLHVAGRGPLTPDDGARFGDHFISPDKRWVLCVRERGQDNDVVSVSLEDGRIEVLASGRDFFIAPRLSPDGSRVAWLCWDHPNMPWDGTELWVAGFEDGRAVDARLVAGGPEESVSQPRWSPDGVLHWVSDRTGWWNLYADGEPLAPMEAEFAEADWALGQSTYAFLPDGTLVATWLSEGTGRLGVVAGGAVREIGTPFASFEHLAACGDGVACVSGSPTRPPAVVRIGLDGNHEIMRASRQVPFDDAYVSRPRAVGHSLFYAPHNPGYEAPDGERPPLMVLSHGGPTGRAYGDLDLEIQFWTTRGVGVVDVNYRGSTGYGRAYRDALKGQWGIADVEDCVAAADELVELGEADPERLVIEGGSAGGWTTLCALTFTDVFAAGLCSYGVADAAALAEDTHKFEARYLDSLIAPWPDGAEEFRRRSPINNTDRLSTPVIVFQGLDDKVVPPAQSERIVQALDRNGIPHAYLAFEGEQHGFRQAATIKRVAEAQLAFLGRVLGFEPYDRAEAVEIRHGNLLRPLSELNLILIGPPGAGKGTQAERLQDDFGLPYIATGDMMRAAKEADDELGREIKSHVEAGNLVPDEIVCKVLLERVDDEGDDGFILDGFPRTIGQAEVLEGALDRRDRRLTAALLIEVDDDEIVQRLAGRRVCPNGHVYHVDFNRPKHDGVCDIDGRPLVQRDDDRPETIRHRLGVYHEQTEPLVERYDEQGILRRFDGTRSPTEVHDHIRATLATLRLEERL